MLLTEQELSIAKQNHDLRVATFDRIPLMLGWKVQSECLQRECDRIIKRGNDIWGVNFKSRTDRQLHSPTFTIDGDVFRGYKDFRERYGYGLLIVSDDLKCDTFDFVEVNSDYCFKDDYFWVDSRPSRYSHQRTPLRYTVQEFLILGD